MSGNNELENMKEKVYKICGDYLQGPWKETSVEDLKLFPVKGGFSSGIGLFRCSISSNTSNRNEEIASQVLIRFYNKDIHSDDKIIQETVVFTIMSEMKMCPKLLGAFPGGRLEEYIPSRCTDYEDFTDLSICIAKELAKLHCLEMPIKKTPVFEERCYEWLEEFEKFNEVKKIDVPDFFSNGDLRNELKWTIEKAHKVFQKVVFCHNDLHGGNVLLKDHSENTENNITFIDYEFNGYNYRTYDIAYFFLTKSIYFERVKTPVEFSINIDNYPTKLEQKKFISAYVKQLQVIHTEIKDEEINIIQNELRFMKLAPLLSWLTLAAKEFVNPQIPFPFQASPLGVFNINL